MVMTPSDGIDIGLNVAALAPVARIVRAYERNWLDSPAPAAIHP